MNKPTEKQINFIKIIESYISEKFIGTTKQEASDYISRNITQYREIKEIEDEGMNTNYWAIVNGY